jgi:hypothetical protein
MNLILTGKVSIALFYFCSRASFRSYLGDMTEDESQALLRDSGFTGTIEMLSGPGMATRSGR